MKWVATSLSVFFLWVCVAHASPVDATYTGKLLINGGDVFSGIGRLDVGNRDLVIQTKAEDREAVFAWVNSLVKLARGAGDWSGLGITSSFADSLKGLVVLLNDRGDGTPLLPRYGDVNTIIVKFGWIGDLDFNGVVNADDIFKMDKALFKGGKGYLAGDLNGDGVVNRDDLNLLYSVYNGQTGRLVDHNPIYAQAVRGVRADAGNPSIPVPPAVWAGAMLLVGMGAWRGYRNWAR